VTGGPVFLVTYPIPEPGMSSLHAAGRVHVPTTPPTAAELTDACRSGEFDVVVAQLGDRFDAQLLAQSKLTGISNYAVGYDNIDIPAATGNKIVVGNTPGVLTDATADLTMLLILATARRAIEADQFTRSGLFTGWKPDLLLGHDVSGATLGLAGFGRIARATAQRAAAFGMTISFCSHPPAGRLVDDAELEALPYPARQVSWTELVERSDFLSLHLPLAPTTRHLIDATTLAAMKPTAILINTARGPIVDERALVDALRDGRIAGAGLDVYEREPHLAPGLAELANVVLLPHVGSATTRVRARMAELCADNAIAIGHGHLPPHCVNPEAWP
jgi:glyoxylate reductase